MRGGSARAGREEEGDFGGWRCGGHIYLLIAVLLRLPSQIQILPNSTKPSQAGAKQNLKKQALISLDFLCRFEPFQCVALTPKAKYSFLHFSPKLASAVTEALRVFVAQLLIFAKEIPTPFGEGTVLRDPSAASGGHSLSRPSV
jgi:hypothetical protein